MEKNVVLKSWIDQYSAPLLKRAKYLISDSEDAEDIVQEVFIAAFNSFESFQEKSQPLTWLMSILKRKVADFYRKKYKKGQQINMNFFFDESGNWKNRDIINDWNVSENEKSLLDDVEFNQILKNCIDDLPPKWKTLVKLYYLEEKKTDIVSQELELTTTNIWKILQRSRLQLRECLESNWFSKI